MNVHRPHTARATVFFGLEDGELPHVPKLVLLYLGTRILQLS